MFSTVAESFIMKTILTASYLLGILTVIRAKIITNSGEPEVNIRNNYPRYALNYAVREDNKAQWEGTNINVYPFLESDGNMRIVEYAADDVTGFSALVKTIAATLNSPQPYLKPFFIPLPDMSLPILNPLYYGFGAANLAMRIPSVKISGSSLPWDPKTGSYGGWIPIRRPIQRMPTATIMSKKYVNGHLQKVVYSPIPLPQRSVVVIKKKKINYD